MLDIDRETWAAACESKKYQKRRGLFGISSGNGNCLCVMGVGMVALGCVTEMEGDTIGDTVGFQRRTGIHALGPYRHGDWIDALPKRIADRVRQCRSMVNLNDNTTLTLAELGAVVRLADFDVEV